MEIISFAVLVLIALAIFAGLKNRPDESGISYHSKNILFSQAERSFLGILEQVLDNRRYRVLGKVRLGDVVKPAKGLSRSNRTRALNKINQKHVDFVICTTDDLAVVAAIELDDQSHERPDRAARDQFVDTVLHQASIPIAHFSAKRGYGIHEVRAKLVELGLYEREKSVTAKEAISVVPPEKTTANQAASPLLKDKPAAKEVPPQLCSEPRAANEPPPPAEEVAPTCPKCAVRLVKRKAVKGAHAGKSFWACPNFPNCRHIVAIES